MTLKLTLTFFAAVLGLAAAQPSAATPSSDPAALVASAELQDADGNVVGDVNITESEGEGGTFLTVQVGLEPGAGLEPGEYGFHIHETGACTPSFDAAGDHLNPEGVAHGLLSPEGPHAGDLPNVVVAADGTTTYAVNTELFALRDGDAALFDDDGSAVMLHAQADDYITDPSGGSGDRIACGVVAEEAGG